MFMAQAGNLAAGLSGGMWVCSNEEPGGVDSDGVDRSSMEIWHREIGRGYRFGHL